LGGIKLNHKFLNRNIVLLAVSVLAVSLVSYAAATNETPTPQQWEVASGGNDNYYQVKLVTGATPKTWLQAQTDANALTLMINGVLVNGHLVTITSAAENTFVTGLDNFERSYTGFTGKETDTGNPIVEGQAVSEITYSWVTGEPSFDSAGAGVSYRNWDAGEPNNISFDGAGPVENFEKYGEILGNVVPSKFGKWNDISNNNGFTTHYVVEFESAETLKITSPLDLDFIMQPFKIFVDLITNPGDFYELIFEIHGFAPDVQFFTSGVTQFMLSSTTFTPPDGTYVIWVSLSSASLSTPLMQQISVTVDNEPPVVQTGPSFSTKIVGWA